MFGFLFKKKKKAKPDDPLVAYDAYLEDLERQAGEVRRSAATLLALRSTLSRDQDKYRRQVTDAKARLKKAEEKGDGKSSKVLRGDVEHAEKLIVTADESLCRAETDAQLLMEAAKELAKKAEQLRAERASAKVRFAAGMAVTSAMKHEVTKVDRVLALDRARDEVERAFALAEIYREDQGSAPEES